MRVIEASTDRSQYASGITVWGEEMQEMERFVGKSVVVTGAGSGFGEAIAKRFAREGASVIVADIDAARADRWSLRSSPRMAKRARCVRMSRVPMRCAR